jgi:hypothetical protein
MPRLLCNTEVHRRAQKSSLSSWRYRMNCNCIRGWGWGFLAAKLLVGRIPHKWQLININVCPWGLWAVGTTGSGMNYVTVRTWIMPGSATTSWSLQAAISMYPLRCFHAPIYATQASFSTHQLCLRYWPKLSHGNVEETFDVMWWRHYQMSA